jgi:hypothetical protein
MRNYMYIVLRIVDVIYAATEQQIVFVFRSIEPYQVILPNADSTRCPSAEASSVSPIEVEMYLANESSIFDHRLTLDFYTFWRESGLPDFPFDVSYLK